MKKLKEIFDYTTGYFIDFKGLKHYITICAMSRELPDAEELDKKYSSLESIKANSMSTDTIAAAQDKIDDLPSAYEVDTWHPGIGTDWKCNIVKCLSLGVTVCNPEDEYNEEYGKIRAQALAKSNTPIIWSTKKGCINTPMVRSLLQQELDYLIANPDQIIKGYSDCKKRWGAKQKAHLNYSNLQGEEKTVAKFIKDNPKRTKELAELIKSLG